MILRSLLAATLLIPSLALADVSPYAGQETREIKALSKAEIDGLLQGRGMELALPAELNGYPGPAHALELAKQLALTQDQAHSLDRIKEDMAASAKALGSEIVERERSLDRLFADRLADGEKLRATSLEIGALRGRLRVVHLAAHLETTAVLSPEQSRRYTVLRGYAQSSASDRGHSAGARSHNQRNH